MTLTTVGYGDLSAHKPATKLFACVYILVGVALVASFLAQLVELLLDEQVSVRTHTQRSMRAPGFRLVVEVVVVVGVFVVLRSGQWREGRGRRLSLPALTRGRLTAVVGPGAIPPVSSFCSLFRRFFRGVARAGRKQNSPPWAQRPVRQKWSDRCVFRKSVWAITAAFCPQKQSCVACPRCREEERIPSRVCCPPKELRVVRYPPLGLNGPSACPTPTRSCPLLVPVTPPQEDLLMRLLKKSRAQAMGVDQASDAEKVRGLDVFPSSRSRCSAQVKSFPPAFQVSQPSSSPLRVDGAGW